MRKSAKFVGHHLLCGDCLVKLTVQYDTQEEKGNGQCWSCPICGEWFTISGAPAIVGTCEPESDSQ